MLCCSCVLFVCVFSVFVGVCCLLSLVMVVVVVCVCVVVVC